MVRNNREVINFGINTPSWFLVVFSVLSSISIALLFYFNFIKTTLDDFGKLGFAEIVFSIFFMILICGSFILSFLLIRDKLINKKSPYLYKIIIENNFVSFIIKHDKQTLEKKFDISEIQSCVLVSKNHKEHKMYINNEFIAGRNTIEYYYKGWADYPEGKFLKLSKYIKCFEHKEI